MQVFAELILLKNSCRGFRQVKKNLPLLGGRNFLQVIVQCYFFFLTTESFLWTESTVMCIESPVVILCIESVTVVVVEGVLSILLVESLDVVVESVELLQAAKTHAIAMIANNFFIILFFMICKIPRKLKV
jgi:hypothetical protein